jgi:hypothetical protein
LVFITQKEFKEMKALNLLKEGNERNYVVLNRKKNSRAKTYAVVEPDYNEYKKYL